MRENKLYWTAENLEIAFANVESQLAKAISKFSAVGCDAGNTARACALILVEYDIDKSETVPSNRWVKSQFQFYMLNITGCLSADVTKI